MARAGSPAGADSGEPASGACIDLEHDVLAREQHAPRGSWAGSRTRGFVKVQDGCNCHCAYCIIPTVRGSARSRPASAVLREVAGRVEQNQPEVVMTGISVGDYRDPEQGLELGELLVAAARVPGVQRVRLSSVEVIHVKDTLVAALREEPKRLPAPARPDAVGRRRGARRRWVATTPPRSISTRSARCAPRCRA